MTNLISDDNIAIRNELLAGDIFDFIYELSETLTSSISLDK